MVGGTRVLGRPGFDHGGECASARAARLERFGERQGLLRVVKRDQPGDVRQHPRAFRRQRLSQRPRRCRFPVASCPVLGEAGKPGRALPGLRQRGDGCQRFAGVRVGPGAGDLPQHVGAELLGSHVPSRQCVLPSGLGVSTRALAGEHAFESRHHRERLGNRALASNPEVLRDREDRQRGGAARCPRQSIRVGQRRLRVLPGPRREHAIDNVVIAAAHRLDPRHRRKGIGLDELGEDGGLYGFALPCWFQLAGLGQQTEERRPVGVRELPVQCGGLLEVAGKLKDVGQGKFALGLRWAIFLGGLPRRPVGEQRREIKLGGAVADQPDRGRDAAQESGSDGNPDLPHRFSRRAP